MQDIRNERSNEITPEQKKAYTRPELVKHGKVESMTLFTRPDISGPIQST